MATNSNNWKPNSKQEQFLKDLGTFENPVSLSELNEKLGKDYKTGTINTLITKGLVEHGEDVEILVTVKRKVKSYKLVNKGE